MCNGQGGKERGAAGEAAPIIVTEAMKAAGIYAAREHLLGGPLVDLVTNVYLAMALEANSAASEIIRSK